MKKVRLNPFMIMGIAVRTTNKNEQAAQDINQLWDRFISENIKSKIPNRINDNIYAVYTDYEGDHTKPYTMILGCEVDRFDQIPVGMIPRHFIGGNHVKFTAKGNLTEDAVYNEWQKIWNSDLNRSYTADIEIYGKKAVNPVNGEADILIAVSN